MVGAALGWVGEGEWMDVDVRLAAFLGEPAPVGMLLLGFPWQVLFW